MPTPVPPPVNEPVLSYAPGTPERAALKEALATMANDRAEIPVVAGGRTFRTGKTLNVVMPHRHAHVLAVAHEAGTDEVVTAIDAAMRVAPMWAALAFEDRAAIFLRAADLLAGRHRQRVNA